VQILIVMAFHLAAVLNGASMQPRALRSDPVLVRAVLDGDTIDVATIGRVRLLGIDAPEVAHTYETAAPFGRDARERLTSLVLHRWVRLERDGQERDVYDRHLAYVLTEDGQCVNTVLVREGLARVSIRQPIARLDELQRAEREAQSARRGMWEHVPQVSGEPSPRSPQARPKSRRPSARRPPMPDGR